MASSPVDSADKGIRDALVRFMDNLSLQRDGSWGWNSTSDPCTDRWRGITCDSQSQKVTKIVLEGLDLRGTLDAKSLCEAKSVRVVSLNGNNVGGEIKDEISNCDLLTHLYLKGNKFSGALPRSLSSLRYLKRLDISDNDLTGKLPELGRVSGLLSFLAQDNRLTGNLPDFNFPNFEEFNVSNNDLEGRIPDVQGHFGESSFLGNPRLCGTPLPNDCPQSPEKPSSSSKHWHVDRFLIYLGYAVVGGVILVLIVFKVLKRAPKKDGKIDCDIKSRTIHESSNISKKAKSDGTRSGYSITSAESGVTATSLTILNGHLGVTDLRFEDLLRAPAELLGRGKHGSLYKVSLSSGIVLAVKRIKGFSFSSEEFAIRMEKIDRAKHPNVLPPLAYYCSGQEKLVVYEYRPNGNLFGLLHGKFQI